MSNHTGDISAIRDWFNASLYNKDEIVDLFVQNNSGLQAYDLTIIGSEDQMIKMVGQTSGKIYYICLDMIQGVSSLYKGVFFFTAGENVKIFDTDSGSELLTHTLSNTTDEIDLT